MKKIPFDYFEQGQTLYFNMQRLEDLENLIGKPVGDILHSTMSVGIMVSALMVGLKHHNPLGSRQFYYSKLEDYDGTKTDIWESISKALLVSGLFSNKLADAILENKEVEPDEKNV